MKKKKHGMTALADGWFMLTDNLTSIKVYYQTSIVISKPPFTIASVQTEPDKSIKLGKEIPNIGAVGVSCLGRADRWKASTGARIAVGRARKALEHKLLGHHSKVENNPYMG